MKRDHLSAWSSLSCSKGGDMSKPQSKPMMISKVFSSAD